MEQFVYGGRGGGGGYAAYRNGIVQCIFQRRMLHSLIGWFSLDLGTKSEESYQLVSLETD